MFFFLANATECNRAKFKKIAKNYTYPILVTSKKEKESESIYLIQIKSKSPQLTLGMILLSSETSTVPFQQVHSIITFPNPNVIYFRLYKIKLTEYIIVNDRQDTAQDSKSIREFLNIIIFRNICHKRTFDFRRRGP
jgi:hypothetical protein